MKVSVTKLEPYSDHFSGWLCWPKATLLGSYSLARWS